MQRPMINVSASSCRLAVGWIKVSPVLHLSDYLWRGKWWGVLAAYYEARQVVRSVLRELVVARAVFLSARP